MQPVFRRGWRTDVLCFFVTALLRKPLLRLLFIIPAAVLVLIGLVTAELFGSGTCSGFGRLRRQRRWLQTIQISLAVGFMGGLKSPAVSLRPERRSGCG